VQRGHGEGGTVHRVSLRLDPADARRVIANPDIDIVVELIGGYGIARTLVLEAIAG